MIESGPEVNPRWGDSNRSTKALAILGTLQENYGAGVIRGKWLDVGCGSGQIAATLAQYVESIRGIDPEPWRCWSRLSDTVSNLQFSVGSVDELSSLVIENSIDVAICNQVYEHVPDASHLIRELYRLLRPGGICYFAGPNLLWPIEPHVFLPFVHWLPRTAVVRTLSRLGVRRIRELDAWSLDYWRIRKELSRTGFEVESAFATRARAGLAAGERGLATRLAARLPSCVEKLFLP